MTDFFGGAFFGGGFFGGETPPTPSIPDRPGHLMGKAARKARPLHALALRKLRDDEEIILLLMMGDATWQA